MSRFHLILAVVTLGIPSISTAEWYSIRGTGKPDRTIRGEDRGKTFEVPLYKLDLRVTDVVLRRDTERADYYWLEATLADWRDLGDGYFLAFGDVVLGEIYTRGNKWAIGFTSIDTARRCFQHLRELHQLKADHARDTTQHLTLRWSELPPRVTPAACAAGRRAALASCHATAVAHLCLVRRFSAIC